MTTCKTCKHLRKVMGNELMACGHEHPYMQGKVYVSWWGCVLWEEKDIGVENR